MGFDVSKYVKSRWLRGADLPAGQPTTATIKAVYEFTFESSGETKPAIDFYELEQSLTLNKTQCQTMIDLFGTNPDEWNGKAINLMPVRSNYQGKPTISITAAPVPTNGSGNAPLQGDAAAEVQFQ